MFFVEVPMFSDESRVRSLSFPAREQSGYERSSKVMPIRNRSEKTGGTGKIHKRRAFREPPAIRLLSAGTVFGTPFTVTVIRTVRVLSFTIPLCLCRIIPRKRDFVKVRGQRFPFFDLCCGKTAAPARRNYPRMTVNADGTDFADCRFDPAFSKPLLGPIRDKGGHSFTRCARRNEDHPHQRSVIAAVGSDNGVDFRNAPRRLRLYP